MTKVSAKQKTPEPTKPDAEALARRMARTAAFNQILRAMMAAAFEGRKHNPDLIGPDHMKQAARLVALWFDQIPNDRLAGGNPAYMVRKHSEAGNFTIEFGPPPPIEGEGKADHE